MNTTTTPAPLHPGQSRSFAAGEHHLITVERTVAGYIVTATADGKDLPTYRGEYTDPTRIPAGMSLRMAAFEHALRVYQTFIDLPAPVAPVAEPAPVEETLPERWYQIMLAAVSNGGQIRPMTGCATADLRGLARRGYLALETAGARIRKGVVTADGRVATQAEYAARRTAHTNHQIAA